MAPTKYMEVKKMKSEVVYIGALFKGETGIKLESICEVLLFECSLPNHIAVVVPYFENVTITLKKSDIKYYLYDEKINLIKIKLTKPLKDRSDVPRSETCEQVAFELLPNPDDICEESSLSNQTKSEFCLFQEFANKYFHGVKSKQMVDNDIFDGDFYTHNMLMMRTLFTQNVLTITSFYDRRFKALLRAYVYFLNHMQLNEKKFKKFMRSQENLPNLMKNILGFEDCRGFFFILSEFLRSHICDNEQCYKTSHKKCSSCRLVSSCSMECHTKSWAEHKEMCNEEESGRKLFEKQRRTILDLLVTQFSTATTPVSYEVFQQELFDAVFVVSCPLMKDSNDLDILIGPWFEDVPKSKWTEEMLSLKKKQYAKMYRNLSCGKVQMQWKAAWGGVFTRRFLS